MRRTARLFAIAEYLRGRRTGVTAEALAERFSGSRARMMYRDLEHALREGVSRSRQIADPGRLRARQRATCCRR